MSDLEADNQSLRSNRLLVWLVILILVVAIGVIAWYLIMRVGSPASADPYHETFESVGAWTSGEDVGAVGQVVDGVYELSVEESGATYWVTAGQSFVDGQYVLETTPVEGVLDNGYGMLFRVNNDENNFYVFKISSDGYVFIGRCFDSCLDQKAIVNQDWFSSAAVNQGLNVTNTLRAVVNGSAMIFYVNDQEVGRAKNNDFSEGDIGLMAETFMPGGLRVAFDNFQVIPLE